MLTSLMKKPMRSVLALSNFLEQDLHGRYTRRNLLLRLNLASSLEADPSWLKSPAPAYRTATTSLNMEALERVQQIHQKCKRGRYSLTFPIKLALMNTSNLERSYARNNHAS